MFNSHYLKFKKTISALELAGHWLLVETCSCGEIHAYSMLDKAPDARVKHISETEISEEIKEHLIQKMLEKGHIKELPQDKLISK